MDKANQLNSEMASVKQSFQDGCNTLVNKCQSIGITPASNSPTDIANAIQQIRDGSLEAGRQQVTGNPNNYNLFTADQYNNNYNNGYNAGKIAGATTAITTYQKVGSKIASGTPTNFTYTFSSNKTICVVAVGIYDKDPFALEMWLQGNARITQKEYAKHDPVLYVIWTVEGQAGQSISLTSQAYTNNEHMVEAYIIG